MAQMPAPWKLTGPNLFPINASGQINGIGRVCQVQFHPTKPGVMYAVSASGGLWMSNDNAISWASVGTDKMPQTACASVCIDYTNDSIMYLGTGDPNYYGMFTCLGIWKTTDAGTTWKQSTTGFGNAIALDILMDPQDHNILVAATNKGIYKSYDAGATWLAKKSGGDFRDMTMKANATTRTLYAVTGSDFFLSNDMGETWQQTLLPYAGAGKGLRVAVTPADSNTVYVGLVLDGGTILKSGDGGLSFSTMRHDPNILLNGYDETSPGQGDYDFDICVDPTNAANVYLAAHCMWNSVDSGVTWTRQTSWYFGLHTDMHQILFSPYETSKLFNANDGGVWLSTDGGNQWAPVSDGLGATECYHSAQSPVNKDLISIGTQDNGELYYTSNGWFTNRGGDWGSKMFFDANKNNNQVYYMDNTNRRDPVGGFDAPFDAPFPLSSTSRMEVNPLAPEIALFISADVWRTDQLSSSSLTWQKTANVGASIRDVFWSSTNADVFYIVQSAQNKIWRSDNFLSATPTYTIKIPTTSIGAITSLVASNINPAKLFVACGSKAYTSQDTGTTWVDMSSGLPASSVRKLFLDPYSGNHDLYAFFAKDVYFKNDTMSKWVNYSLGLPTVANTKDFMVYCDATSESVLRISYYGRGVWERGLCRTNPISGIKDIAVKANAVLNVFPNPTKNGEFNVNYNTNQSGLHQLSIYSVTGQQVYAEQITVTANVLNKSISLASGLKGLYLLVIQKPDGRSVSAKVLVQ